MPIDDMSWSLTKGMYQAHFPKLVQPNFKKFISTGGSSGAPIQFPTDRYYAKKCYENSLISRLHFENYFDKKIALLWGHSHLMGTGTLYSFQKIQRDLKDTLVNTKRFSAYKLDDCSFEHLIKYCRKNKPILIGYSSAVVQFAHFVSTYGGGKKSELLSGVICTAEQLNSDMLEFLRSVFQVDIVNEYGSAEFGVIGFSVNSQNFRLIWDSFKIDVEDNNLIITSLDRDIFPLIRYNIGDIGSVTDATKFNVIGRANDNIEVMTSNGIMKIHSEVLTHIIKLNQNITNFNILSDIERNIKVNLKTTQNYSLKFEKTIKTELGRALGANIVSEVIFDYKYREVLTVAGKKKWISKEYDC